MAYGVFIDVPAMAGTLAVAARFRVWLKKQLVKIPLPVPIVATLASIPFFVLEEHINCDAFGCTSVVLPPTLWFLVPEILVVMIVLKKLKIHSLKKRLAIYVVFGMLFEFTVGFARKSLWGLMTANPLFFLFVMVWVGFSYLYVAYLPFYIMTPDNPVPHTNFPKP